MRTRKTFDGHRRADGGSLGSYHGWIKGTCASLWLCYGMPACQVSAQAVSLIMMIALTHLQWGRLVQRWCTLLCYSACIKYVFDSKVPQQLVNGKQRFMLSMPKARSLCVPPLWQPSWSPERTWETMRAYKKTEHHLVVDTRWCGDTLPACTPSRTNPLQCVGFTINISIWLLRWY